MGSLLATILVASHHAHAHAHGGMTMADIMAAQAGRDPWADQPRHAMALLYLLAAILATGTLCHLARAAEHRFGAVRRLLAPANGGLMVRWRAAARSLLMRRYYGATTTAWLVIGGVMLFVTVMSFSIQPYYREMIGMGSSPLALRSGWLAIALMPVVVLLGLKVTPLTLLTGLSYAELNVYHRWFSRIMLFLSTVHTIPFLVQNGNAGNLQTWFTANRSLLVYGIVAYVALFLICISSFLKLRNLAYEFFVVQHIVISILYIAFLWLHVHKLLVSDKYMYATVGIWGGGILMRSFMHIFPNVLGGERRLRRGVFNATITALPDMLQITVPVNDQIRWAAGQHVFLRWGGMARIMQNHPYTIANAKLMSDTPMTIMIRVMNGVTQALYDEVMQTSPSGMRVAGDAAPSLTKWVSVDGPYGAKIPTERYNELVLVAAGSGAASIVAPLQAWVAQHAAALATAARTPHEGLPLRVSVVWVARRPAHLATWYETPLREALASLKQLGVDATVRVYVTQPEMATAETPGKAQPSAKIGSTTLVAASSGPADALPESMTGMSVAHGRPDLAVLLPQIWSTSAGRVACVSCGPGPFMVAVEKAVVAQQRVMARGASRVVDLALFAESYGW
ncbi:hypothetical protein CXG81DRAFT_23908 [Caulochytrium protostelioides]|uniref:ferric-chelate reductase (NADPH) n=1 Tax=Caulochytrium protostelioides TaxID=1555241 RepID=A0A4P9XEC9_9FUNG|nr:hypothetical protein CXG81DRAFT_23908 [Caulochytrium protostelioides]|eukprot:RKP03510.1 hypothetical protein CXG81DRAFT_23908 [Caulochytrium protostelioides]